MNTHKVTTKPEQSSLPKRIHNAKSTATEAQYLRIADMTRTGAKSTIELRRAGVMMPAARIKEMNEKRGFNIARVALRDIWDEWGFCHPRVAIYALISEPTGTEAA
jgi:hypothetical protein